MQEYLQQQTQNSFKLEAQNLYKSFKYKVAVNNVSFSVEPGKVVGLLGPNGAGKTTSFYMIVGLLFPQKGDVFLGGDRITFNPMHIRARKGISYLPQNSSIFRKLTVEENLLAIMEIVGIERHLRKDYVEELLNRFNLTQVANVAGISLSGGERRRVEIARALIPKPKFLLLDEPFAGIDPVTVQEIQQIILKLKKDGLGVLITDHNVRETLSSCDYSYILFQGKIIAKGSAQDIFNNETVREIYLGHNFKL